MLILTSGSILLCVGTARVFDLSPLVASMAVGATMVNISSRSLGLVDALQGTDPPFYAIFFVLAGADLDLGLISTMGVLGVAYILARAVGKFAGARIGARWLGLDDNVRRYLGFALMAQAGLAVGLTLAVEARFEDLAPRVTTIVLAAVAFHEVIGPIAARFALVRAGETPDQPMGGPGSLLALE
jgi:Kef-type K+ transport system membrane component KefB